ncbi:MAG TPA: aminotransferase class V-fold PLP-dependent enzyme, partial [Thermoproteota archaeon]|nr:aminotransferase class V-fold PLP-dependent enzyme [Thermoproteota archaeon]
AAACMTGTDPDKVSQLPDTTGLRSEIVVQKVQRNKYDRCIRISGAKLVDAGDEFGTTPEQLELAFNPRTAAVVHFVLDPLKGSLQLEQVIAIARKHGVPVIVDAAAEIPPPENLRKFVSMGADLVLVSGGKQLRGPNDSGMLFGRKDLIEAAYMNAFPGSQGIGRAMKISKEQVVGLVVALQRYVSKNHDTEMRGWTRMANRISYKLSAIPHVKAEVTRASGRVRPLCIPRVEVRIDETAFGMTISELVNELKTGDPIVEVLPMADGKSLQVNPQCLSRGEDDTVVRRMRQILLRRRPAK